MATAAGTVELVSHDQAAASDLNEFGYKQELHRSIGTYASFAAGFSFVSILTTVFQLFGFGFSFAGPFFFWTWPAVFVGQLTVALCFAELAARYPLSGAIYQWSRRLGGHIVGWFAAWTMVVAQIVTAAAAAIAMQAVLPAIWSGFQLVGGDPSIASLTGATNAILLGLIVLVITTLINSVAVKVMAVVNTVGVTAELIGAALLIIALFSTSVRGPGIVLDTSSVTSFGSLLAAGLMAGYVLVGFDSAGELAEETHNPRKTTPRTILRALTFSGIGGALILLSALMASPSLGDELSSGGLAYVVTSRLGDVWGRVFLADVVLAAFVCTLAIQTATTRMIYSMSRDEVLPFSKRLRTVSGRGATVYAAVLVGIGAAALLLINLGHSGVFTALTSTCIVLLYLAYLCVTVPMLYRRLKGWPKDLGPQEDEAGNLVFNLGRWGLPVNILAVTWGVAMAVNLAWPRQEVYDPDGASPVLQYFGIIIVAATVIGGIIAFNVKKRDYRTAIGHQAQPRPRRGRASRRVIRITPEPRASTHGRLARAHRTEPHPGPHPLSPVAQGSAICQIRPLAAKPASYFCRRRESNHPHQPRDQNMPTKSLSTTDTSARQIRTLVGSCLVLAVVIGAAGHVLNIRGWSFGISILLVATALIMVIGRAIARLAEPTEEDERQIRAVERLPR